MVAITITGVTPAARPLLDDGFQRGDVQGGAASVRDEAQPGAAQAGDASHDFSSERVRVSVGVRRERPAHPARFASPPVACSRAASSATSVAEEPTPGSRPLAGGVEAEGRRHIFQQVDQPV